MYFETKCSLSSADVSVSGGAGSGHFVPLIPRPSAGYLPERIDEADATLRKVNALKAKPDAATKRRLLHETLPDRRHFLTARKTCSLKKLRDRYPDLFQADEVNSGQSSGSQTGFAAFY